MAETIILNPTSFPPPPIAVEQTCLKDLQGRKIGFLSNNKSNADALLSRLSKQLHERFGILVEHFNKGIPSLEASRDLLDQIGNTCEGVIIAVSD